MKRVKAMDEGSIQRVDGYRVGFVESEGNVGFVMWGVRRELFMMNFC